MISNRKVNKRSRATNKLGDYSDEKEQLFAFLKKESKLGLLELLEEAFDEMPVKIRRSVFGDLMDKLRCSRIEGTNLLKEVESFKRKSNNGDFYAAFDINSKNYMNIPAETEEWFDRLGDFLNAACELTKRKDYANAVRVFEILYELIECMERGDEIVFSDELGSWMIPVRENECIEAYLQSAAIAMKPDTYVQLAKELITRDQHNSGTLGAYNSAKKYAKGDKADIFLEKVHNFKSRSDR